MFNPQNFEDGKHQVVGQCNDIPMEERWKAETPIFADIILKEIAGANTVLDYGCGIGRLAKEVIKNNNSVTIYGVDSSEEMLREAKKYVNSDKFIPVSPKEFDGKTVDFAYCVYVLQHIPALYLREAIRQISDSCNKLFLVNSLARMAISDEGFQNDGIDILDEVNRFYSHFSSTILFTEIVNNPVIKKMFLTGDTLHYAVMCEK